MSQSMLAFFSFFRKKTMRCLFLIFPLMWVDLTHAADPFDPDKTWFIFGSTTGRLDVFFEEVLEGTEFPRPDATATDINIVFLPDGFEASPLAGLHQTFNFGGGRRDALRQMQQYSGALSVGMFLRDQRECGRNLPLRALAGDETVAEEFNQDVLDAYTSHLDEMIDFFVATGREVLLRIGNNFDNPELCYTPDLFIAGFRAIKERIDEKGATNIYTVWEPTTNPFLSPPIRASVEELEERFGDNAIAFDHIQDDHLDRWYPGDEFVDVISFPYFHGEEFQEFAFPALGCEGDREEPLLPGLTFREMQNRVLDFAKAHDKPAMIAEGAPLGVNLGENTVNCQFANDVGFDRINSIPSQPITDDEIWDLWYEGYFNFIRENTDIIKAATYTHFSWATLPFEAAGNGYRGDSELRLNDEISARFEEALREPHFKNEPIGSLDVNPNVESEDGRLEAEQGQSPVVFAQGDFFPTAQQVRVAIPGASNASVYNVFTNEGELEFGFGVTAGNQILIRYATNQLTTPNSEDGEPFTFSVLVDGEIAADVPYTNTFEGEFDDFTDVTVPAEVNDGSLITLRVNTGRSVNFDFIRVQNGDEIDTEGNAEGNAEDDSEGNTEDDSEGNTEDDSEGNAEDDSEGNAEDDSEGNTEDDSEGNTEDDSEGNTEDGSEGNTEDDSEGNAEDDSEGNAEI